MSVASHRSQAPARVACAVLTISDTRTTETDTGGRAIADLLASAGHPVVERRLVRDEPAQVAETVRTWMARGDVQAIITTGGTGLSTRDSTYEALAGLFVKRIDGFGELFRSLSFQEIGSAAMLSRAAAGIAGGCVIFLLPGSEPAVRLGMEKLILPELGHVVGQLGTQV
jgi:molybdenum cofactor biosynthesis protein B